MLRDSGYVVSDPTAKLERLSLKPTEFFIPGKEEFVRIVEEIRRAPLLRKYREKSLDSPAADMVAFWPTLACGLKKPDAWYGAILEKTPYPSRQLNMQSKDGYCILTQLYGM